MICLLILIIEKIGSFKSVSIRVSQGLHRQRDLPRLHAREGQIDRYFFFSLSLDLILSGDYKTNPTWIIF